MAVLAVESMRVYTQPEGERIRHPMRKKARRLTIHVYTCRLCAKMTQMELQALPCYCATLRQAARAATALYEAVLGESGVPLTQFTALQVMLRSPNLTTTELAEMIGIDQTTATRTLAHIKKAGLARTASAGDRRERRWGLTDKGEGN